MRASHLLALFLPFVLGACVKAKAPESHVKEAGPEIHNFEIPDEQDPTLVTQTQLDLGDYTATKIRVTRLEGGRYTGTKWTMVHTFNVPGMPAKGDPILKRGDWVNIDATMFSSVHQLLPMRVEITADGRLNYFETIYLGESMGSDGSWSWRWHTDGQGRDALFLLSTPTSASNVKWVIANKFTQMATIRKIGASSFNAIEYYQDEEGTQTYTEVTYVKN